MSIIKTTEQIKNLVGKKIFYFAKDYEVLAVYDNGTNITVATDKKMFTIEQNKVVDFYKSVEIIGEVKSVQKIQATETAMETAKAIDKSKLNSLTDILFESIKKIKEDKEYIPQADSINSQAKTIIDIAKTEIEMIKLLRQ
jgi:hypothetical protein